MNRAVTGAAGYTIVETMIFLAVSGLMLLSAMLFLSGQQQKNEFATGIRDVQSQLSDVMNDVATGAYDNTSDFVCTAPVGSGRPVVSAGAAEQGTNARCTFLGKALQFAPDANEEEVVVHTLVGRRVAGSPETDVMTLTQAAPVSLPQVQSTIQLPYGIRIKRVMHGAGVDASLLAFVSQITQRSGRGGITGTQSIDLTPVSGSTMNMTRTAAANLIDSNLATSPTNPNTGVTLCFDSGGTDQHANILIGGDGRQTSTVLTVDSGLC